MQWLIGIIAALFGYIVYLYHSLNDVKGLLDNQELKEKLLDETKQQNENELKIDALRKQVEQLNVNTKDMTDEELVEWFNNNNIDK